MKHCQTRSSAVNTEMDIVCQELFRTWRPSGQGQDGVTTNHSLPVLNRAGRSRTGSGHFHQRRTVCVNEARNFLANRGRIVTSCEQRKLRHMCITLPLVC